MAQAAIALGLERLAGIDAKMEALAKLEAIAEELNTEYEQFRSAGFLRLAVMAWRRGNITRAGKLALRATEIDPTNAKAFHVLAMALERMGHMHKALVTYERAFALDPEDPEILINLGLMAWNQKMTDGAAKLFEHYIAAKPESPLGYNNLGSILADMGHPEDAITTLRGAIMQMPEQPILWNSLATVLAEEGRAEESLVFYQEAVRLSPDFSRPYHNLGYAYSHLGRLDEALAAYDRACELAVDPTEKIEAEHSRSICLIGMGHLEKGFATYEIRNSPRFRAYVHYATKAPQWAGEPLSGKRLLVIGEQGLGDEFMFANTLPDLTEALGPEGKLQIAVDRRLVPLFARSFPKADVGVYDDRTVIEPDGRSEYRLVSFAQVNGEPDFYAPMGSVLGPFRRTLTDFPHKPFLVPDPTRVAAYRKALLALGEGPYVGLCWRSMMLAAKRAKYYSTLERWEPILKTPGVTFVTLQYGDSSAELKQAMEQFGVKIHAMPGLDLKDDIDGAAALSAALDLVLSAPTAAAAAAASVGTEVWFLTAGRTWPQLGTDEYPWYAKSRVFSPEKFGDWNSLMPTVARALAMRAAQARPKNFCDLVKPPHGWDKPVVEHAE